MQTDRRTYTTKLTAAFRSFRKALNENIHCEYVPQKHHPSLEARMASEPSGATSCFAGVVVHSQLKWDLQDSFANTRNDTTLLGRLLACSLEAG